jgi:hypothetical protein
MMLHKVPTIDRDSALYDQLIKARDEMEAKLMPARISDILTVLARLRFHYPTAGMNEKQFSYLLEDYVEDLSIYPIDLINDACKAYRRDGKHQFFPKIGELLTLIKEHWYPRRSRLQRINTLIDNSK